MSRLSVYTTLVKSGLVPVFYMPTIQQAEAYVQACKDGGLSVFEFTNRGQAALPVFQHLRKAFPDIILGIGSVVDAPTAALYIAYGADFIVSPMLDHDTAILCNQRKVAYLPGCGSVTEMQAAHRLGVEIIKLFPASHYGADFIKAVCAPMPWVRIMPTGGINATVEDLQPWFEAGACCVGVGSSLQKADDVTKTCRDLLAWIIAYKERTDHDI